MSTPTLYEQVVNQREAVKRSTLVNGFEAGAFDLVFECLETLLKPVNMLIPGSNRSVAAETVCAYVGRYFALRDAYTAGGGGDPKQIHEAIQGIREAYADYLKTCK